MKVHPFIKAQHAYLQVVIFNWLGRPNKNTVLGELATMSEAATFINRGQRGNAFGHLILLLRDVQVNGEKEVYSIVFENEDSDGASTDEEATAMEERNKTRNLLKKTFETVRVVCMPSPHAEIGGRYMFFLVLFNATLYWVGARHFFGRANMCDNAPLLCIFLTYFYPPIPANGIAWRLWLPMGTRSCFDKNVTHLNQRRRIRLTVPRYLPLNRFRCNAGFSYKRFRRGPRLNV